MVLLQCALASVIPLNDRCEGAFSFSLGNLPALSLIRFTISSERKKKVRPGDSLTDRLDGGVGCKG